MIDQDIEKLKDKLPALNDEQVKAIRLAMANYAMAAMMDSAIRKEAIQVCSEE